VGNRGEAFSFNPPPFSELVVDGHIEGILGGGASAKALPASAPRAIMHSAATRAQNKRLVGCSTQVAYVSAKVMMAWPYRFPPLHVPSALGLSSFSHTDEGWGRQTCSDRNTYRVGSIRLLSRGGSCPAANLSL
jgi:hypothetical protein